MSTKFYLWRAGEPCPTCGHDPVDTPVQIGHSAGGWVFLWRGWRADEPGPAARPLETPAEWFAFLAEEVERGGLIVDEYDTRHTLAWFSDLVLTKREPSPRRTPRRHSDLPGTQIVHVDGDDFAFYEIG